MILHRPQKAPSWLVAFAITLVRVICSLTPCDDQKRNLGVWDAVRRLLVTINKFRHRQEKAT